jgi:hypothetical protein
MKINITYPSKNITRIKREHILKIIRWPFLAISYIALITNLIFGGLWWSILIVVFLYMIWNIFFGLDLVEYNRIRQFTKIAIYICVMLFLIDLILIEGWMFEVLSITSFSLLVIAGVLFFSDIERQKQNMMPLFTLIILNVIGTVLGLLFDKGSFYWTYIVMGSISLAIIVLCIIVLGRNFIIQLIKRFYIR